ncbi:error-prone DNA polymerase [Allorhizobium taibaishanense]|uniref:Error-prone DNA polymerase n=1 Tax=Allorhizobium taibaishanense TaxID=887144 RepID=A0A1Q9A648_9HYPH|nr:error-prone DNA polymerase [Allorhizobium taibaishanense]MBB4008845.1 error-prone DNA polymerase [Allorhizobium taibaishanense]OLP50045.1 error-prone DNA polymerase [Allorhizobium taibaishanense]
MSGPYVELQVTSHFSFLRGASSCEELFEEAKELGFAALAIADRHSLAGLVRAHQAAKETGVRLVVGCRLDLSCGMNVLVYPMDRAAYGRLCRLLSLGKKRAGKGQCLLHWDDLLAFGEGLIAVLVPDEADETCAYHLRRLRQGFADLAYLALTLRRRPNDQLRLFHLSQLAEAADVPTVVTNDVLFHRPERRILQDVVTCIRHNVTIDNAGFRRERHADRYLKPPEEMYRLFPRDGDAVARTAALAARCRFSLDELAYQYPEEKLHADLSPQETLEKLTWEGAQFRYPEGVPDKVRRSLEHELRLIAQLEYAPYFLTVNSIVGFARSENILCQGRGSAANSAVCYVLGITSIDPSESDLLFERFISVERREPPDIDVDFEHQRREEVIQWVYNTYGRDRAALCAVVTRYRAKGALRDVGKALGLPEDLIRTLSSQVWRWSDAIEEKHIEGLNLNLKDRRLRLVLELARQLIGAPRHLSQHPGGFVLTHDRLDELVPIEPAAMEDRQVIEWDKDDIDILKFMKVDVLGLGMLSCMQRCFDMIEEYKGGRYTLANIPPDDRQTYDMICRADTLGVFQIESRAQMAMLPRMQPKCLYDLVIEVAIVRPGPIQGDMVHPYLRRRQGKEKEEYPKPELRNVLKKTLGVPLFQEQAMRVAIDCGGFTPGEADQLRRSMATFKHTGGVSKFAEKLIEGMVANGYERDFAERTFRQLEGFGSYGFPESHAASFALIAYASSWVKCHHPDVFCAALLNSQPMGFYAPAQIVRDAREHGVTVLPVCINASRWDTVLEGEGRNGVFAVRLGLSMVRGLDNEAAGFLVANRANQPFVSIEDLWQRAGVSQEALVRLAEADAMQSCLGLTRRDALWAIKRLADEPLPLFAAALRNGPVVEQIEPPVVLRSMTAGSEVVQDYGHVGLTLRDHPVSFLRDDLRQKGFLSCAQALSRRDRTKVEIAGMVLVRQRPGSAKGVMFITIEDETGIANLVVWPKIFEQFRRVVLGAGMLGVRGHIQREGAVVHLVVRHLEDLSSQLAGIAGRDKPFPLPHGRGDEFHHGAPPHDPRTRLKMPPPKTLDDPYRHLDEIRVKSRDFR